VKKQVTKKNISRKEGVQFCIDGFYVDEILKGLNGSVQIIGAQIRFGMPMKRQKVVVPTKLRKLGCSLMYQILPTLEAEIILDKTTPALIRKVVKQVAEHVGIDPAQAQFAYITLTNGEGTGRWVKTTKEMAPKDENEALDLRRKAKMLGLTDASGKIQSLIADIGAGKYQCDFQDVQIKQIALCKKVN
jgi:hypothetical protein